MRERETEREARNGGRERDTEAEKKKGIGGGEPVKKRRVERLAGRVKEEEKKIGERRKKEKRASIARTESRSRNEDESRLKTAKTESNRDVSLTARNRRDGGGREGWGWGL